MAVSAVLTPEACRIEKEWTVCTLLSQLCFAFSFPCGKTDSRWHNGNFQTPLQIEHEETSWGGRLGRNPLFLHSCLNSPAMDLILKNPKTCIQSRKEFFLLSFCSGRSLSFSTENSVAFSVAWDYTHFPCLVPVAFLLCSLWLQHAWPLCDDHVGTGMFMITFVLSTFFFCLHKWTLTSVLRGTDQDPQILEKEKLIFEVGD